ncbi:MAG: hypothetical protein ACRDRV_18970 [Pseudonocardiaceae bacterium]
MGPRSGQHVLRTFWQRCDTLNNGGALTRDYDELPALIRRQHAKSAQFRRMKAPEPAEDGEQQGVVDAFVLRIRLVAGPRLVVQLDHPQGARSIVLVAPDHVAEPEMRREITRRESG